MKYYHKTSLSRLEDILRHGLKIGQNLHLTTNDELIELFYKVNPIHISIDEPWQTRHDNYITLEVEIGNIKKYPDLGSLIYDLNFYIDEDGIYLEEDNMFAKQMLEYFDDDSDYYISYGRLWDDQQLIDYLISLTKTFTVMENIKPNKLKMV